MRTPDINKILASEPGCNRYGAQMGRRESCEDLGAEALYLQYVRFSDGCYDPGGAYWGMPAESDELESADFDA